MSKITKTNGPTPTGAQVGGKMVDMDGRCKDTGNRQGAEGHDARITPRTYQRSTAGQHGSDARWSRSERPYEQNEQQAGQPVDEGVVEASLEQQRAGP